MQEKSLQFKLQLNPVIRYLFISSLSATAFSVMHTGQHLSRLITDNDLIDMVQLKALKEKINSTPDSEFVVLSLDDEILIYTAIDIHCKMYLTDISDEFEKFNKEQMETVGISFVNLRNIILNSGQIALENMKNAFSEFPDFKRRTDLLSSEEFNKV